MSSSSILQKRKLSSTEIDDILSVIKPFINYTFTDDNIIIDNLKHNLNKQLSNIYVYPTIIPLLKKEIEKQYISSQVQPGEMVGIIAATSISEVQTQGALNSFHSSGLNKAHLTSGLDRFNELLNATKNIKTPSLTILFNPSISKNLCQIRDFCHVNLQYLTLEDVVDQTTIFYYNHNTYQNNWWEDLWKTFFINPYQDDDDDDNDTSFICLRLHLNIHKLYNCKKSLIHIIEHIAANIHHDDIFSFVCSNDDDGIIDLYLKNSIQDIPSSIDIKNINQDIINNIQQNIKDLPSISFIKNILLPNILSIPFNGVRGIKECYYTELKTGDWQVDTKGGIFKDLKYFDLIDFYHCKSNNPWDIYEIFGIEATKNYLRDEFLSLCSVSHRHLDVLIETMAWSGKITSVNRYGIDRTQVGPIAKASFEQPVENFLISASKSEVDNNKGVCSTVTTGSLGRFGTGLVDLVLDIDKLSSTSFQSITTNNSITKQQNIDIDTTNNDINNNNDDDDVEWIQDDKQDIDDDITMDEDLLSYCNDDDNGDIY